MQLGLSLSITGGGFAAVSSAPVPSMLVVGNQETDGTVPFEIAISPTSATPTIYTVFSTSATPPTASQIVARQEASGAAAPAYAEFVWGIGGVSLPSITSVSLTTGPGYWHATCTGSSVVLTSVLVTFSTAYNVLFEPTVRARFLGSSGISTSTGVSAWTDQVAGLVVSQGSGTAQPTYSNPTLTFDGVNDQLDNTTSRMGLGANPALTVAMVVQFVSTPATTSTAWGIGTGAGNLRGVAGSTGIGWAHGNGNRYFGATPSNASGYHVIVWSRASGDNYGQQKLQIDGSDQAEVSVSNPATVPTITTPEFSIGTAPSITTRANMLVREVTFLETADTTIINKVVGDMAWRWDSALGLVAKLPAGHPYKSTVPTA